MVLVSRLGGRLPSQTGTVPHTTRSGGRPNQATPASDQPQHRKADQSVTNPTPTDHAHPLPEGAVDLARLAARHGWTTRHCHPFDLDTIIHSVSLHKPDAMITAYWDISDGGDLLDENYYLHIGGPGPTHTNNPRVVARWVTGEAFADVIQAAS